VPIPGVVENMSYLNCPHCGEPIEVFHRSKHTWAIEDQALTLLGRIPMDIAISRGIDAGHPLVQAAPDSAGTKIFREIATQIANQRLYSGQNEKQSFVLVGTQRVPVACCARLTTSAPNGHPSKQAPLHQTPVLKLIPV